MMCFSLFILMRLTLFLYDGLYYLYYKSRIYIPEVGDHKNNILEDCHNILISIIKDLKKHMWQ